MKASTIIVLVIAAFVGILVLAKVTSKGNGLGSGAPASDPDSTPLLDMGLGITGFVDNTLKDVKDAVSDLGGNPDKINDAVSDGISNVFSGLADTLGDLQQGLQQAGEQLSSDIDTFMEANTVKVDDPENKSLILGLSIPGYDQDVSPNPSPGYDPSTEITYTPTPPKTYNPIIRKQKTSEFNRVGVR